MRKLFLALAGFVLLTGCDRDSPDWGGTVSDSAGVAMVDNPLEGDWSIHPAPTISEELRIGAVGGDPVYQFGVIVGVDVDDSGRIYVLDQQMSLVRVFDANGQHIRSLGRPGTGPGELSPATMGIVVGNDETVFVADAMAQRVIGFAPDGSATPGSRFDITSGVPVRIVVAPEGQFVIQFRTMDLTGRNAQPMQDRIILRDPASDSARTLMELESGASFQVSAGGMPSFRLFEAEPMWTLFDDGRIVHGRTDTFRLEVISLEGSLERVITRPVERRPVTEADRAAFLDFMRATLLDQMMSSGVGPQAAAMVQQMVESTQFADFYPAYAMLLTGPGETVWVQRIRTADDVSAEGGEFLAQDVGSTVWDVFDDLGRLLGAVRLPEKFMALRVHGNHIYGVQRDHLDVQYLLRLRVDGLDDVPGLAG